MFGLIIVRDNGDDIVKVTSTRAKAEALAIEEIFTYIKDNEVKFDKGSTLAKSLEMVKEALAVRDIDSATDLFSLVTEQLQNCLMLSISKVEIVHDC